MYEIRALFTRPNSTLRSPDYEFYCCGKKRIDKEHSINAQRAKSRLREADFESIYSEWSSHFRYQ